MKKIISLLLVFLISASCVVYVYGEECAHNSFLRTFVSASCYEKGHTLYTCRSCSTEWKVYDDEYSAPEDFYILAQSTREGSTLTVTIEIFNNPGLAAARLQLHYNEKTLTPKSVQVGDVWPKSDFTGGLNISGNPITFFVESKSKQNIHNYNNGTFVTIEFDIIDANGSYNIGLSHSKADFVGWDSETNKTVIKTPTIINIIGKNELLPHSYESTVTPPTCAKEGYTTHICSVCDDTYTSDTTPVVDHSYVLAGYTVEPTFENEGVAEYSCTVCKSTTTKAVPVLEHWKKGDVNNDKSINALDSNMMKRILTGIPASLQACDAADYNGDGLLNSVDANSLKRRIAGK